MVTKSFQKHFKVSEFWAHDGSVGVSDVIKVETKLIKKSWKNSFSYGITAVIIIDGYRTPEYSAKWGGGGDDAHTRGLAADIVLIKKKIKRCRRRLPPVLHSL